MTKILFGLHRREENMNRAFLFTARAVGCDQAVFYTGEEVIREARKPEYTACFMEANIGHPGSTNPADLIACEQAYNSFKERYPDDVNQRFLAISGAGRMVDLMKERGIPFRTKPFNAAEFFGAIPKD